MTIPIPAVPDLIERSPSVIEAAVLADLRTILGRELQPAQVETLLGKVLAYRETLVRIAIQDAALQSYVAFARGVMLDYLGQNFGVTRLPAIAAEATFEFTLVAPQGAPVVIPIGTRVQSNDRQQVFESIEELVIDTGDTTGTVVATAQTEGAAANGYAAGSIAQLLDPIATVASVENTDESANGADVEDDERLRARIPQASDRFSVAGPTGAYRFYALSVNTHIIDASVITPAPGTVRVYVLTDEGLPGAPLIADVLAALSDKTVRPLTDTVQVQAPTEVNYTIDATVELLTGADATAVLAAVQAAAEAYAADRRAGIGRDVVQSQLMALLQVPGVYRVTLAEPDDIDVSSSEWANCTDIDITQGASAEG